MIRWFGLSIVALATAACAQTPPAATPAAATPLPAESLPAAPKPIRTASADTRLVAPPLADYTDTVLFTDLWRRPALAMRDRSLVTMSALVAIAQSAQMPGHFNLGLDNGVKPSEIAGVIRQLANYDGRARPIGNAYAVAKEVHESRGLGAEWLAASAPAASATDDPWRRTDLTPRDRSIVMVSAYIATGNVVALKPELARAHKNGVTKVEISELITHLAFYAGWPKAMSAIPVAKAVFDDPAGSETAIAPAANAPALNIIRRGTAVADGGGGSNFTGKVDVASRFPNLGVTPVSAAVVTFQPGARTAWHSHPLGQTLVVLSGIGWVQVEGGPREDIREGDIVEIPPGARHWHGATATAAMSHFAVSQALEGKVVDWMEPVPDAAYRGK